MQETEASDDDVAGVRKRERVALLIGAACSQLGVDGGFFAMLNVGRRESVRFGLVKVVVLTEIFEPAFSGEEAARIRDRPLASQEF